MFLIVVSGSVWERFGALLMLPKMAFDVALGELAGVGGFRLGEGCLLVSIGACDVIVEGLRGFGVGARRLEAYVSGDRVRALFG